MNHLERLMALWGSLPTTQARVSFTLGALALTAVRYTASGIGPITTWEPTYEWLGFMVLMSGLDAAQFFAKRTTDTGYVAAKAGNGPPAPPPNEPGG